MPIALITGVNGQDGSYLAEYLLEKEYQLVGWIPDFPDIDLKNIANILNSITLVRGSLEDQSGLEDLMRTYRPDEIYHFASPSSPSASWNSVVQVGESAALGVARLLEAMRHYVPAARFYQASSSELFGNPVEVPQSETTPFHPRNPYGISKLYAHWMIHNYRERYGLFTVAGILYNHESPRRGDQFVTRKITREAARIKLGLANELPLGNLEARRDWGYAGDYIEAIYAMMHLDAPEDFVIGTGTTHSVRDFCEEAFSCLGLDYRDYVRVDPAFYRPDESRQLVANPAKAKQNLGWFPRTDFSTLVQRMVEADLKKASSTA
jgi:GDPmannose 4,6-dehydratase